MQNTLKDTLTELLSKITEILDVPDHLHDDAVLKYEEIGEWLAAEDSQLKLYAPEIYPQGSFRLGTVVRPLSEKDEYDIDLVCHLRIEKEKVTQEELKQMVGDRLKERAEIKDLLEECRRCWSLDYPQQFHMDVLPAIPNNERQPTGILLTDTDLIKWQKSNPIAYADWFYARMEVMLQEKKAEFAESIRASIEDVPEWQVKTPLQRAVQLLKRHRDIYFQNDQENKPVSIIITTLAAWAYRNQVNLYDTLLDIIRDMTKFIENRSGKWWVANPVDPDENFADKWNEKAERRLAFFKWHERIQSDFADIVDKRSLYEFAESLSTPFGRSAVLTAAKSLGLDFSEGAVIHRAILIQIPALADSQHCRAPEWPLMLSYKASITGTVYRALYSKKKLWDLTDRPVPKNVGLRFVISTNVPPPYEVRWQVVNTGREAAIAGQLRGGFYRSDDSTDAVRWESTSYAGTHWIEAFIIKNDVCVARSNRKFVKIRS